MRNIITFFLVLLISTLYVSSQNSSIENSDFETTSPVNISWVSQTNTGNDVIVNEDNIFSINNNLHAHSGNYFAAVGGIQDASGLYQSTLGQQFNSGTGLGHLGFYYKYGRESVDPGSYVTIFIDGMEVWSLSPHFIVDATDEYVYVSVDLGYLDAGQHTIELKSYEHPLGGDLPMLFSFDDVVLQVTSTASVEENNTDLDLNYLPGMIQIQTNTVIDKDAQIELVDLSGKVIASTITHFETSCSIPVQFYNTGIYILNFRSEGLNVSKKIFIRH